jgi:hypothetical protein
MKLAQAVSFLGIVGIVGNVVATPITGDIVFSGAYSMDKADLSQASKFTLFHDVSVVGSTGAYAVVPANFSGAIYNVFARLCHTFLFGHSIPARAWMRSRFPSTSHR